MALLPGWSWPDAPIDTRSVWDRLVAPGWADWMPVVGRYLASKAHASWAMYLGDGPRAVERLVDLARTVLQVEAIRACVTDDTALDRARLRHAIRRADLLLVHLTDPRTLVESTTDSASLRPLSLRVRARER
jgi:DNA-binding FadR family transcriptional regulator